MIKQIKQIFIIYSLRGFQIYEKEMTSTHAPNLNKQHLNTGLCSNQTHQFTVKAHHKCTQETKLVKRQREKKWPMIHVDDRLNWSKHVNNVKKGFFNNLNLLKRSRFPPKIMLLYLYFRVIMPSIVYSIPVWGGLTNREGLNALEALHCTAARIIFDLPWEMSKVHVVVNKVKWPSLAFTVCIRLA